ncbi:MAG: DUF2283 domain-containing protein [Candidatus Polarisedimenticolia bacterium]
MKIVYHPSTNSAMIYLTEIPPGAVARMYACDPREVGGMINLDFDKDGRLLGIEVLDARGKLPHDALAKAEVRG